MKIREARPEDIERLLEIERKSFTTPWSASAFAFELKDPRRRLFVLEEAGKVVGYVSGWFLGEELHVANLAVDPSERRRGFGKALMKYLLEVAKKEGVKKAFLEVRERNLAAIRLYEGLGFRCVGYRKRYYPDTREGALIFELDLSS